MSEVTQLLAAAQDGDPSAPAHLLPLVYDELRKLAAAKMAQEKPGLTLDATALVHEAYLRLVPSAKPQAIWDGRGHFFAAAAEAMRRILIENARRKKAEKHGGGQAAVEVSEGDWITTTTPDELLAVDEALTQLAAEDAEAAQIVKLRYYAGLSVEEAAEALGIARATAYRHWTYGRAWLRSVVLGDDDNSGK